MNCYNHPDIVAVDQCCSCGKFLCKKCVAKDQPILCKTCSVKNAVNSKLGALSELLVIYGFGAIIYLVCAIPFESELAKSHDKTSFIMQYHSIILFYLSSGFIAGWKGLNNFTPSFFIVFSIIGWLIYLYIKFVASLIAGAVILPIRTFKNIRILLAKRSLNY